MSSKPAWTIYQDTVLYLIVIYIQYAYTYTYITHTNTYTHTMSIVLPQLHVEIPYM